MMGSKYLKFQITCCGRKFNFHRSRVVQQACKAQNVQLAEIPFILHQYSDYPLRETKLVNVYCATHKL